MSAFRRSASACIVAALGFVVASCSETATSPQAPPDARFTHGEVQGNGAPNGWHFNLNIIGVEKGHENELDPNSRHTLFVQLWGKCDIDLTEGDYQVLDWSCLDGDNAAFQLPNPDDDSDDVLDYSVWVRALGKPNGSAEMRTCFTEFESNTTWCNAGDLVVQLSRLTGPHGPKFVDVSKELLQVCADVDETAGTDLELVPLFSDLGEDYFWHYDNEGLRLAQMRFYPISTTNVGGDCTRVTHASIH